MPDWIDSEHHRRSEGINRPLLHSEHQAVNARYPECTWEHCCECGQPTGRAGRHDDSLFIDDDGPYCWECYSEIAECPQ